MRLPRLLTPRTVASAHCDLPCGVYDPAQARIEAQSVKAICEKYQANSDPEFRTRALIIKEAAGRARQAPPLGAVDRLLQARRTSRSTRTCTSSSTRPPSWPVPPGAKGSADPAVADQLLGKIDEIAKIFWETKQA